MNHIRLYQYIPSRDRNGDVNSYSVHVSLVNYQQISRIDYWHESLSAYKYYGSRVFFLDGSSILVVESVKQIEKIAGLCQIKKPDLLSVFEWKEAVSWLYDMVVLYDKRLCEIDGAENVHNDLHTKALSRARKAYESIVQYFSEINPK